MLIDVVLILADADRLWLDLHQFGQGILQTPSDADCSAQADVQFGELLRGQFAGRIDAGPGLADHHFRRLILTGQQRQKIRHKLLGLPAGGTVADGNELHPVLADQTGNRDLGTLEIILRLERINGVCRHHPTGRVDHRNLDASTDAGIKAHRSLSTCGCRKQQVLQIAGKDPDRLGLGRLAQFCHKIQRQAGLDLDAPGPGRRLTQPDVSGPAAIGTHCGPTGPFGRAFTAGGLGINL